MLPGTGSSTQTNDIKVRVGRGCSGAIQLYIDFIGNRQKRWLGYLKVVVHSGPSAPDIPDLKVVTHMPEARKPPKCSLPQRVQILHS